MISKVKSRLSSNFCMIFNVRMKDVYIIFKAKILVLLEWSYRFSSISLDPSLTTHHSPLKCRYLIKIRNQYRPTCVSFAFAWSDPATNFPTQSSFCMHFVVGMETMDLQLEKKVSKIHTTTNSNPPTFQWFEISRISTSPKIR